MRPIPAQAIIDEDTDSGYASQVIHAVVQATHP
jgi:hypothetical protein